MGILRRLSCEGHIGKPLHIYSGLLETDLIKAVEIYSKDCVEKALVTQQSLYTFVQVSWETELIELI